jgi:predicted  nucleic acid-binding Zn-ribbon protein
MIRDFGRKEAQGALNHFKRNGVKDGHDKGLFKPGALWGRSKIDVETAMERLDKGKDVQIPDRGDDYYEIETYKELQILDDLLGRQEGFALTADQASAIMSLENGPSEKDGIYDPGFFKDSRKDAFTAAQEILEGEELNVRMGADKENPVRSFDDFQELDAFQGSGQNTILPEAEFKAMTEYENSMSFQIANSDDQKAYDALNSMQAGGAVGINSRGRTARAESPTDAAELHALEGGAPSTDPTIEKLLYFEQAGGDDAFLVGGNHGYAYESLQQIQDGRRVGVEAAGAYNSVSSGKDLSDLDDLLGRQENQLLPDDQMSSLKALSQGIGEGEGLFTGREPLNVYGSYKAIENSNQTPHYKFQGGDFNEQLSVPVENFGSLGDVQTRVENQKEYDRYAFSESEMKGKYANITDGMKGAFQGQFQAKADSVDNAATQMNEAVMSGQELTHQVTDLPQQVERFGGDLKELVDGRNLDSAVQDVRLSESHMTTAKRTEESFQNNSKAMDSSVSGFQSDLRGLKSDIATASKPATPEQQKDPKWNGVERALDRVQQDLESFTQGLGDLSKLRKLSASVFGDVKAALSGAKKGLDKAQSEAPKMTDLVNDMQRDFRRLDSDTKYWNDGLGRADKAMKDSNSELRGLNSESDTSSVKAGLQRVGTEIEASQTDGQAVVKSLQKGPEKTQQMGKILTEVSDGLKVWPEKMDGVENSRRDLEAEIRFAQRMPRQIQRDLSALQDSVTEFSTKVLQAAPELQSKASQLIESALGFDSGVDSIKSDIERLSGDSQTLFDGLTRVDTNVRGLSDDVARLNKASSTLETGTQAAVAQAKKTMNLQESTRSAAGSCVAYLETVPATQAAVAELSADLPDVSSRTLGDRKASAQSLSDNCDGSLKKAALRAERLLQTQLERPARPDGWVAPEPRV